MLHKPVLLAETLEYLKLRPGMIVVDGTLGRGGHTAAMLEQIGPKGRLIALDQDPQAIRACQERFEGDDRISFHHENYENLENVLSELNIPEVDAVLLDIGFSSDQLEDPERGFSFEREGPLDMRMNPATQVSARDLVNDLSQEDLANVFWEYGEERRSRSFAKQICESRYKRPIETTQDLASVLYEILPSAMKAPKGKRPPWARKNPLTRVFQALRIAVNRELDVLTEGVPRIWQKVKVGGRLVIISFHSLEDRIVKNMFRDWVRNQEAERLTKKPVVPERDEILENSRSRSAKLRAVEKK